ncbi:hypothetical protein GDO78_009234 [Eleutherodactylus coqui]|uniref:Uncharacterized protein n=1 Tax=Eleutherodactylus coqui TaxID=57060 RepID=A0A8J6F9W2_ELECQ|nr:hypothetical protein GDO78_009234 [Eleutherodactylus coqui]
MADKVLFVAALNCPTTPPLCMMAIASNQETNTAMSKEKELLRWSLRGAEVLRKKYCLQAAGDVVCSKITVLRYNDVITDSIIIKCV